MRVSELSSFGKGVAWAFIIIYLALFFGTYSNLIKLRNFNPNDITDVSTLKSQTPLLIKTPLIDSIIEGKTPWQDDAAFLLNLKDTLSAEKTDSYVKLILNVALSFFFVFSGIAFLFIGSGINSTLNKSPKETRAELKPFFGKAERDDYTMISLSLAILIWLIGNLVYLGTPYIKQYQPFIKGFLSSLNSAFFLVASIDFEYDKKPKWLKSYFINRYFQTFDGVLKTLGFIILISVPFSLMEESPESGFNWAFLPDFLYSLIAIVIVGCGLWKLFCHRLYIEMGIMAIVCMALVLLAQIVVFYPNIFNQLSPNNQRLFQLLLSAGYKTTLIALFLILAITWVTRQKEKDGEYHASALKDKINELDIRNAELSKINIERDRINKSLVSTKNEIAHRVKNSLSILHNFVESRIGLYAHNPDDTTYSELWKIRVRSEGILLVHEFLDKKLNDEMADKISDIRQSGGDGDRPLEKKLNDEAAEKEKALQRIITNNKVHDKVMFKLFLEDLLLRLEKAFGYEKGNFYYDFSGIDDMLAAKLGIAKDIAMAITELAINVNQHAYPNGEEKKIRVAGYNDAETLFIKVEDEGIGGTGMTMKIEKGHGRAIVDEIVSQHEARIISTSLDSRGFTAVLEFPVKNLN